MAEEPLDVNTGQRGESPVPARAPSATGEAANGAPPARLEALLRANHAVVEHLELPVVLERIVEAAMELVGADYGALGVIAAHGGIDQFIHVGMDQADVERIGRFPEGHGLLGALIDDPHPIRLHRVADDPRSCGVPAGHPPMGGFLGVPIRVRDQVYGNLYLSNRRDGGFNDEDDRLITALAATAGVAIENARLFAETQRRQAWSAASAEITSTLLSEAHSDSIVLLVDRVLELSTADLVCMLVPSGRPDELIVDVAAGRGAAGLRGVLIPISDSIARRVIEGRRPELLDDSEITLPDGRELGPAMAVPLIAAGRAEGVLVVARMAPALRFTTADLDMAADFAGQASVAMQLAKARADRQRLLLLEDRGRIARDLHDHVIQQIFGTGLELQSIAGSLAGEPAAARIHKSVEHLDASISQIRTAIFALTAPSGPADDAVRHLILDLATELSPRLASIPQVSFSGPVDLLVTGDLARDVIAVIREGLTNTAKHAAAGHVSVSIAVAEGWVVIDMTDDGGGIVDHGRRSGLANLTHRAEIRGGTFQLNPEAYPDEATTGTHLRWSVPYSLAAG
ncbi:GAF domain-containing protein [Herbiconiux sp. CPCC 205763]|uniref:GAF domain-containing protein n=1 Tax=Herbiconiux aconitum TaxID=2970913 RepID=A0ABT2GPJ0_9MICO|nr:GAF domain-containing protein [Herbiconiux aconitum]MCS5718139.1 GAF domain-containing protein [Herbiconiux aconitum]